MKFNFFRYEKKEDATKAIMEMNGKEISGNAVRCSWGRTAQSQVEVEISELFSKAIFNLETFGSQPALATP